MELTMRDRLWLSAAAVLGILSAIFAPAHAQDMQIAGCKTVFTMPVKCPRSNFSGIDLRGQLFAMADLSTSTFDRADLEDLDLWKADLHQSSFRYAKMTGVFLTGADLSNADLRDADLSYAFLFKAKTEGASFEGADLSGARWITGAVCGPGSIGTCKPLPLSEDFAPRPLTWHLLPPACREYWSKNVGVADDSQASKSSLPPGCGDPRGVAPKTR
jgi:pentapeptide repeat protein